MPSLTDMYVAAWMCAPLLLVALIALFAVGNAWGERPKSWPHTRHRGMWTRTPPRR